MMNWTWKRKPADDGLEAVLAATGGAFRRMSPRTRELFLVSTLGDTAVVARRDEKAINETFHYMFRQEGLEVARMGNDLHLTL